MDWSRSEEMLARARRVIPGGVNSNVRLLAVPQPLFFSHGRGPRITDVDGNTYIDYVLGQGPLIHGHGHPELLRAAAEAMERGMMFAAQHAYEVELAERVCALVPSAERVRFGSSGSEVVQVAMRIARARTGRRKLVKFEGHYHGWFDNVLASVAPPPDQAGPPDAPRPVAGSKGQHEAALEDLVVLPWNDAELLEKTLRARGSEIAGVFTEPIMGNVGCVMPRPGYLETMRKLCDELGIVLVFDEIITGFRLAPGGAQQYLGVKPDLCTFGKAMAGGFPIACLAGRADLMEMLTAGVNHSGTYNANLLVTAASIACLDRLTRDDGAAYRHLTTLGARLRDGIAARAAEVGVDVQIQGPGPMFHVGFCRQPITDYRSAAQMDTARYHRFTAALLRRGVRVLERGLWYVSTVHTDAEIDETLEAVQEALREVR
jgi:glutamate-1-semialdehyde 2,1-aminomutase